MDGLWVRLALLIASATSLSEMLARGDKGLLIDCRSITSGMGGEIEFRSAASGRGEEGSE